MKSKNQNIYIVRLLSGNITMEYKTLKDYFPSKETVKKIVATGLVAIAIAGAATTFTGCVGTYDSTSVQEGGGDGGDGGDGASL